MTTATATRKTSKPRTRKPATQRSLRVSKPINGVYSLAITDSKGERDAYFLEPIAADWGRAFRFHKVQPGKGEDAYYDVHADDELGDSCTCPGHTYKDRCKHVAAVRKLIDLHVLPALAAGHVPAETELADLQGGF